MLYHLQDILENDDVKLDSMFVASLLMDLIKVNISNVKREHQRPYGYSLTPVT